MTLFHPGCLAVLPLLWLAAASGDTTGIGIDNFSFGQGIVTIGAGTTIVWTNRDDIPHTVTGLGGAGFRSQALDSGDTYAFTFAQRGTFSYFCSLHPRMRGTVVVK